MERPRERTPIIKRSKGACCTALGITLVCAIFGVGGAAAGDGKYARHLRQERLEASLVGAALAHRTPEQLLLAITPKTHHSTASAPASTPAATTTPATATTVPAATTTTTTPAGTPPATTPADTSTTSNDGAVNPPTGADNGTTTTGTTTTGTTTTGTTTTGTTTTGTTTTGTTTTGTTTTGTTTTGTTTTGTTTTGTTPPGNASGIDDNGVGNTDTGNANTDTGNANSNPASNPFSGAGGSNSTNPECHGRCSGLDQSETSGVVPAALPSTVTPSATPGFNLGVSSTSSTSSASTSSAASTVPTDASTGTQSLTSPITPSPTTPNPTTSSGGSSPNPPLNPLLTGSFASSSLLLKVAKGGTSSQGDTKLVAGAGTGGATAGTLAAGTTGRTAGTTAAAGPDTPASGSAGATLPRPKSPRHDKHQSSGGSGLPEPLSAPAQVLTKFVNVIPSAVWIALAAAFGIALACIAVALRSSRRARRREREFVAISAAAQTDPLTGILNRRGFMDAAERELARASRYDRPFVLAYVDVRGLKAVNDTEGHLVGDELIKAVAGLMKESARADDVVGRIGGDEFALLLGEQTADGAQPVVRRIRAHVEERRAVMEIRVPWELTIGIAAFPHDGTTLEELLGIADRRLYEQRGIALR